MASWLFAQYLLTNEVQIAYAQTEGYVPVTSKAQNSAVYQDYLDGSGVDNEVHYEVKMKASELVLENIGNTFVTPVFNGSASLRDAAGQMIENTTKSVRRKEEINDAYFEKLFAEMSSLYRLDQKQSVSAVIGKRELGSLPVASAILLATLAGIWFFMGVYVIYGIRKKKKH